MLRGNPNNLQRSFQPVDLDRNLIAYPDPGLFGGQIFVDDHLVGVFWQQPAPGNNAWLDCLGIFRQTNDLDPVAFCAIRMDDIAIFDRPTLGYFHIWDAPGFTLGGVAVGAARDFDRSIEGDVASQLFTCSGRCYRS